MIDPAEVEAWLAAVERRFEDMLVDMGGDFPKEHVERIHVLAERTMYFVMMGAAAGLRSGRIKSRDDLRRVEYAIAAGLSGE